MSSPYKKLKTTNQQWVAYINIKKLTPAIAYKIWGLQETDHAQYGKGQQATISCAGGPKYRTQLPGKYLSNMSPQDVADIKRDIIEGRNPYLVYREQLPDNSYRLDIIEKSPANDHLFESGEPVPELEPSLDDLEGAENHNNGENINGQENINGEGNGN